jgi:hypothetical protein
MQVHRVRLRLGLAGCLVQILGVEFALRRAGENPLTTQRAYDPGPIGLNGRNSLKLAPSVK